MEAAAAKRSMEEPRQQPNGGHGNREDDHAVTVAIDPSFLESMTARMNAAPTLLKKTAGGSACCIFRIPQSLRDINPKAYCPHIVSIGPYHHGKEQLQMMEQHKWRFLRHLLHRTGRKLHGYVTEMLLLVPPARDCYSEDLAFSDLHLARMLLLDGCFIVELLRKYGEVVAFEDDDPVFLIPWMIPFLIRDLLQLENQLPFFVIARLFELSTDPDRKIPSLAHLALRFFNNGITRPPEVLDECAASGGKHLLDIFRSSFITEDLKEPKKDNPSAKLIHPARKLREAGIQFRAIEADSFLAIKFNKGVLGIPKLTIDDMSSSFLQNCIAFEQSHPHCSMHFTAYTTFMDCLIDSAKDVSLLCDDKIMENYFGRGEEVAALFNDLGKDVAFDVESCYLAKEFERVNGYYWSSWRMHWASFKSKYFGSPWAFVSAMAAALLLLLTFAQTFFTVWPYFRTVPPR